MYFSFCLSCSKADGLQPSNDADNQTELMKYDDMVDNDANNLAWNVIIKLKPQADASYLATEDPEILALVLKHDLIFGKSLSSSSTTFDYSLYYSLYSMNMENKEDAVKDFLETGKFEAEVIYDSTEGPDWVVKLKLKPHVDTSYLATEDPEIIDLVLKYDATFSQSWWLPTTNPELL